jgi:arsenate reductase (thioredoxin)
VFDFYKQGRIFNYVITVCDKEAAERCPVFIGVTERLHWSFPDPSKFTGTKQEKMDQIKQVREEIKNSILNWIKDIPGEG